MKLYGIAFLPLAMVLAAYQPDVSGDVRQNNSHANLETNGVWCSSKKTDSDKKVGACTWLLNSDALSEKIYSLAFTHRGGAYRNKGLYTLAIQDYNEAIRINPKFSAAYNNRGIAYNDKGLYDRAIQDFDKAIRLSPKHGLSYFNRGNAFSNKGLYDRAIQEFDQTIRLMPSFARAYTNRGRAYRNKGLFDQAIQDFREAIRLRGL